jgi:glycosyltransferase involved in cell wall biosynthesis
MKSNTIITIIIPTYNEELYIQKCLLGVLAFSIPEKHEIEIFVIDGMSNDETRKIVNKLIDADSRIQLFENPKKIQAVALNIGVNKSKGEWILRLDAHATYPSNYLKLCYDTAIKTKADNVGGLFITQPGGTGYQASLVQALTTHKFGVGNAGFRIGMPAGKADTVPYGFYKKQIFNTLGLLDERLVRAQDYEFNRRIIKNGGFIWRNPEIHVFYYNQPTLWSFLRKQIILEAPYNVYMWYLAPYAFAFRHAITGVFAAGVIGGIILSSFFPLIKVIFLSVMGVYFMLALFSAIQQANRYNKSLHILALPISFFLYHFLHGLGILGGMIKIITHTSPVQQKKQSI